MYEYDVRWWALIPVSILLGFTQLFSEVSGLWFSFPSRPEWLWCLAFTAALRTPPVSAICAFGVCGFVRDAVLGSTLGSASISYLLVGWVVLSWRILASDRGLLGEAVMVMVTAFLVAVLRHALDYGSLGYRLIDRVFFISLGDAALTGVVYLPLVLVLCLEAFRPWRERGVF